MDRTFEVTGDTLGYVFLTAGVAALLATFLALLYPFDTVVEIALAVLAVAVVLGMAVDLRGTSTTWNPLSPGPGYDIAWDTVAYPGRTAKERWLKAVNRLPTGEDENKNEED